MFTNPTVVIIYHICMSDHYPIYPLNLNRAAYQSYFNKSEEKNKDDQKDMSDLHARNLL